MEFDVQMMGALALGLAFANGSIKISKPSRATASILHLEILRRKWRKTGTSLKYKALDGDILEVFRWSNHGKYRDFHGFIDGGKEDDGIIQPSFMDISPWK